MQIETPLQVTFFFLFFTLKATYISISVDVKIEHENSYFATLKQQFNKNKLLYRAKEGVENYWKKLKKKWASSSEYLKFEL